MLDAGTHVPLIAWWPGTIRAGVFEGLIGFEDFFPTLLDLAGVSNFDGHLDGRSFLSLLKGEPYTAKPWLFCHYDSRWGRSKAFRGRSARTAEYKLYGDGRFFNVSADPDEVSPLPVAALDSEVAGVRQMLQQVLDDMEKQGSVMSPEGAPETDDP